MAHPSLAGTAGHPRAAHASTATYIKVAAILTVVTALEYGACARRTPRPSGAEQGAVGVALLVLLLAVNGPLHDLSDAYLFSAHMVQHLLLTLVVPPLLIAGTPGWMLRPALRWSGVGST